MPVIKADAYGHGMIQVAKKLMELGSKPAYFGVALYEEGAELRKSGMTNKILVFEPLSKFSLGEAVENNLIPTITGLAQLDLLSDLPSDKTMDVHIKFDSGMGRLGTNSEGVYEIAEKILKNPRLHLDGIYTHFATSDESDHSYADHQIKLFREVLDGLKERGIDYGKAHAANSGAIVNLPDSYFDMVRPGISLYGYYPASQLPDKLNLKPVMSIESIVEQIKVFPKSSAISYGRTYVTNKESRIATVPIGYADGIPRILSNNLNVIINGRFYKQVGRVTMDRIMIELTDDRVNAGDKVTLLGENGTKSIDAWEWSEKCHTIPYEITCNISKRVPRVYV